MIVFEFKGRTAKLHWRISDEALRDADDKTSVVSYSLSESNPTLIGSRIFTNLQRVNVPALTLHSQPIPACSRHPSSPRRWGPVSAVQHSATPPHSSPTPSPHHHPVVESPRYLRCKTKRASMSHYRCKFRNYPVKGSLSPFA